MAAEAAAGAAAVRGGGATSSSSSSSAPVSPESYVGSLISLTSKSEIRYEGILYNINTEESSIGLRNVRSFGTEGRKRDGQQIPASDKVYEYILFRGTDIKDLIVKNTSPTPSVQPTTLPNDPAIIQSRYPQALPTPPTQIPSGYHPPGTLANHNAYAAQLGQQGPQFAAKFPPHQPSGDLGSWNAAAPMQASAPGAVSVPHMYMQGFYPQSSGHPHLQQLPLLRPPGLSMPPLMQQPLQYTQTNPSAPAEVGKMPLQYTQTNPSALAEVGKMPLQFTQTNPSVPAEIGKIPLQYPQTNPSAPAQVGKMPDIPSTMLQPAGSNVAQNAGMLTAMPRDTSAGFLSSQLFEGVRPSTAPLFSSVPSLGVNLPLTTAPAVAPAVSDVELSSTLSSTVHLPSKKATSLLSSALASQTLSQSTPSGPAVSSSAQVESSTLVPSGQNVQTEPTTISSSQTMKTPYRKTQPVEDSKPADNKGKAIKPLLPEASGHRQPNGHRQTNGHRQPETKGPILPLPRQFHNKPNGVAYHNHPNFRGRGRGRGTGNLRPVTKFTEDFDFTAMNEKFNKDEVWGSLGKLRDNGGEPGYSEEDENLNAEEEPFEIKPLYVKDDFFDSLSCDHGTLNSRTKFSERMKIDTETFGNVPRNNRPGRGGGWGFRGGGHAPRGAYRGRGHGGMGRGIQGPHHPNRASY